MLPSPGRTCLSVSIRFFVVRPGAEELWSHVCVRPPAAGVRDQFLVDVRLVSGAGEHIASVEGLCFKRVDRIQRSPAGQRVEDLLYQVIWKEQPASAPSGGAGPNGTWLVVGPAGEITDCVMSDSERAGCAAVALSASAPDALRRDLEAALERNSVVGVIHLRNAAAGPDGRAFETAVADGTLSLLHVVQSVVRYGQDGSPKLVVVTCGAEPLGGALRASAIPQAAAAGLARSVALEHPELRCTLIDVGVEASPRQLATHIVDELRAPEGEPDVAYRDGRRYVRRLARVAAGQLAGSASASNPVELEIGSRACSTACSCSRATASRPDPAKSRSRSRPSASTSATS